MTIRVDLPGHEGRIGYFMHVYSGIPYFPCDPRIEEVRIEDIAHHLAAQGRYNGASKHFLSVAEHCYWCSFIGPDDEALERLMHDAAEAYLGDLIRPLKLLSEFREPYLRLEALNERVIAEKFCLKYPWPPSVKGADEAVCTTEQNQLIAASDKGHLHDQTVAADIQIRCWGPRLAELMFLGRFNYLTALRGAAS